MRTTVVIPTYDEAENLERLAGELHLVSPDLDVLVVDDDSPDGTGAIADRLASGDPRIHVLHRTGQRGLGTAYLAGFDAALEAGADRIVQMDCDFSHDPATVPRLLAALDRADLAIGSRYCRGGGTRHWGLGRRILSRGGSLYARLLLRTPLNDLTGGFKAWRGELLRRMPLGAIRSEGYGFQVEMSHRAFQLDARIVEVPIRFVDRRVGQSKMSRRIFLEAVLMVARLAFSPLPRERSRG